MRLAAALLLALTPAILEAATPMTPPVAERRPHSFTRHGVTIEDPYHWLKDQGYPKIDDADVLAYLKAENAYFDNWRTPRAPLIDTLFEELKGRIKEDDASVPARDGAWEYWWRFDKGAQYRQWLRRPAGGGPEQLILSEPALAEGKAYFRLAGAVPSPDGRLLAYAYDASGDERFTLKVRDLATGADVATVSAKSIGMPVWTADSKALAWQELDDNWRSRRIRLHKLILPAGGEVAAKPTEGASNRDPILYEEPDKGFTVQVGRSTDREWLLITAADNVTSEVRLVPSDRPDAAPLLIRPRRPGVTYDVDVRAGTLFVRANDTHPNFRIATAPVAKPGEWRELIAPSDRHYIRHHQAFGSYLAIMERRDGLDQIRLRTGDGRNRYVTFPEASYTASLGQNMEPEAPLLRLGYSSMVTPNTVFDYDVAADKLVTRKVDEIPSGYDPSRYETLRLTATSRDGARVPISLLRLKGSPKPGPLHLTAYGAYGYAVPPSFSARRLSLVDRGVAFAIAHIRGGDDLGYQWYLDGKLEKRTNTFNDFVDSARALIAQGYAAAGNISASGGSAGGKLMGVVVNTDPELWRAVVAHVPFVDVLNTMLDESLPLTPGEWPEWGNPVADPKAFALLRSYSPYDNLRAGRYPPMLVTGGLNDPRVTYWEPAKWVARLRATKTGDDLLLLKTNMGAGHAGKSGRFEALRETAEEYAFILDAFGLTSAVTNK